MAKQHIVDPQPEMMSPWYIGSFSQHPSWLFSLERSLSLSLWQTLISVSCHLTSCHASETNMYLAASSPPRLPSVSLTGSCPDTGEHWNKVGCSFKCCVNPSHTLHSPVSCGANNIQLKVVSKNYRHGPTSPFMIQGSKYQTPMPLACINNSFFFSCSSVKLRRTINLSKEEP